MGATNIGKEALSLAGVIEKAIIEIEDNRVIDNSNEVNTTESNAQTKSSSDLSKISNKLKAATSKATKAVEMTPLKSVDSLTGAVEEIKKENSAPEKKTLKFVVKFNPSQLSFQAIGGGKVEKKNYTKESVDLQYGAMETRIQMNFQLVFDDYERTQAFMLEKTAGPEAMIRTGVEAAVSAATGRTYSVRPQVEGFIGALRNSGTRKITFHWGNMHYKGQLTYVNAEYNMFSIEGNPIRAVVNMTLLLKDNTMDYSYMKQWQDSYEKVFGNSDISDLGSKVQNVGNLLNINL